MPLPAGLEKLVLSLKRLADRPALLLALLLACNALALPYEGLVYDARLYAFQVLQHRDGTHGDDLFFKYGSQDRFSIFGPLVVPLVRVLGLQAAFFLVYLLGTAFYYWALQRLIFALFKDRLIAVASLFLLSLHFAPFGGMEVFYVNEANLTPRMFAVALVLLALERMLRRRLLVAVVCLAFALLLHPLMAFAGVLILGGWSLFTWLSPRTAGITLGVVVLIVTGILLQESLATRFLGAMDPLWREYVRRVNMHVFPLDWLMHDWVRIIFSFVVALMSARLLSANRDVRRLVLVTAGVGALSLAGGIVACYLPYALPLQAQVHRALWVMQLLTIPLTLRVAQKWWHTGLPPLQRGAVLLLGFCLFVTFVGAPWLPLLIGVLVAPLLLLAARACERPVGPLTPTVAAFAALLVFLAAEGLAFARQETRPLDADIEFVRDFLAAHSKQGAASTVYFPVPRIDTLWVDLQVNSYFHRLQLAGNLFNRANAVEGQRRALLVRRFEIQEFKRMGLLNNDFFRKLMEAFLEGDLDPAPPPIEDLERLCREPGLDYVILRQEFPGCYVASNGNVFIYDCRQLQKKLGHIAP